jgi:hypothetical protein
MLSTVPAVKPACLKKVRRVHFAMVDLLRGIHPWAESARCRRRAAYVEQGLDEERTTELLESGDANCQDQDSYDRPERVDSAWLDRGRTK